MLVADRSDCYLLVRGGEGLDERKQGAVDGAGRKRGHQGRGRFGGGERAAGAAVRPGRGDGDVSCDADTGRREGGCRGGEREFHPIFTRESRCMPKWMRHVLTRLRACCP